MATETSRVAAESERTVTDSERTITDSNRTMLRVLQDIVTDLQELVRSEIRLAQAETREEISKAANASKMLVIGVVFGLYALGFLLLTAVYALELVVAPWLAALLVGMALLIISGATVAAGLERIKRVHAPEKTIGSVKENAQWAKQQIG
jgi:uncharacterized membrane protein YqjE